MILVRPMTVDLAALLASNVPETDAPEWDAETTYAAGDHVMYAHRVYESVADGNVDHQPDTGVTADPPTWLDLGATNRFRMFDSAPSAASQRTGIIDVTVQPSQPVNAVGLVNLSGLEVLVQVLDEDAGVVYSATQSLQDVGLIADWHDFFFAPFERRTDVAFLDLPTTQSPIRIVINAGSGLARCGEVAIGRQEFLGDTLFNTSLGIRDYSKKDSDDFGNTTLVKRGYSKTTDIPVDMESRRLAAVQRALARVRAEPALYVGASYREETIIYGFYRSFTLTIANALRSSGNIELESLTYEGDNALFDGTLISTPAITSPTYDESLPENGLIRGTAFTTLPEGGDTQIEADWQIASDAAFGVIAHQSLADTMNLTEYPIPTGTLTVGQTYYARVLYRGALFGESAWSAAVRFVAGATAAMVTPSIAAPTEGATYNVSKAITSSAFATSPAGVDEHYASDWQIASDNTFASPLYESLRDAANLAALPMPALLAPGSTYYVRVRHHGRKTGPSSWSAARQFIGGAAAGQVLFNVPGNYEWIVPPHVTSISAVAIAAGGASTSYNGGGGGELRWTSSISVTPGQKISIGVPAPGSGGTSAGPARISRSINKVLAILLSAASANGRIGGKSTDFGGGVGEGGGDGGDGGTGGYSAINGGYIKGGGGGTGGYSGPGGNGGYMTGGGTLGAPTSGTGGAASGGAAGLASGYGGGGVGALGAGASGTATGNVGKGGSNGEDATTAAGGDYGGGSSNGQASAGGAVRIIWGSGRAYPSTNTGDV